MSAIGKDAVIAAIISDTGCSKKDAAKAYDSVINSIVEGIAVGGEVDLRGFGKFVRKRTEARQGRNPKTGEQVNIPAGYKVKFNAQKALRDRMPTG